MPAAIPNAVATTPTPTPNPFYPVFPGFDVLRVIGVGAFGEVFKARRLGPPPAGTTTGAAVVPTPDLPAGALCAVKRIAFDRVPEDLEDILREVALMSAASPHPHIAQFHAAFLFPPPRSVPTATNPSKTCCLANGHGRGEGDPDANSLCIVEEWVNGGSIASLFPSHRHFSEAEIGAVVVDALKALKHLHEDCCLVHRDVKASNLLVDGDAGVVKLADFGACGKVEGYAAARYTIIGTPGWMAPEITSALGLLPVHLQQQQAAAAAAAAAGGLSPSQVAARRAGLLLGGTGARRAAAGGGAAATSGVPAGLGAHSYGTDIWSLGVTALEMVFGAPPNADAAFVQTLARHSAPQQAAPSSGASAVPPIADPRLAPRYSATFSAFVAKCLRRDPRQRPTAADLLEGDAFVAAHSGGGGAATPVAAAAANAARRSILRTLAAKASPAAAERSAREAEALLGAKARAADAMRPSLAALYARGDVAGGRGHGSGGSSGGSGAGAMAAAAALVTSSGVGGGGAAPAMDRVLRAGGGMQPPRWRFEPASACGLIDGTEAALPRQEPAGMASGSNATESIAPTSGVRVHHVDPASDGSVSSGAASVRPLTSESDAAQFQRVFAKAFDTAMVPPMSSDPTRTAASNSIPNGGTSAEVAEATKRALDDLVRALKLATVREPGFAARFAAAVVDEATRQPELLAEAAAEAAAMAARRVRPQTLHRSAPRTRSASLAPTPTSPVNTPNGGARPEPLFPMEVVVGSRRTNAGGGSSGNGVADPCAFFFNLWCDDETGRAERRAQR